MDKITGKDPAFLFYYDRFLSGTFTMSAEQVGQYIRLMCIQANKGHVTEKDMLNICKTYDEDVFGKFAEFEPGKFANEVLTETMNKRKAFTESRRNNRLGIKTETSEEHMNNICETGVDHMVNVIKNKDLKQNAAGKQSAKKAETKIKFRTESEEGNEISLTQTENDKLVAEYGQELVNKCYDKLSTYKRIKNYKSKSDYLTIKSWVIDAVTKNTSGPSAVGPGKIDGVIDTFQGAQYTGE